MRILQINSVVNSGSTGRIAEDIGKLLVSMNHESYIAFGRGNQHSASRLIRIGSKWDMYQHGLVSLLFDRHGFSSTKATKKLIKEIELLKPDIIHIHNMHGYYLNIKILLNHIKKHKYKVVLTLHDCWVFTGHCTHFEYEGCYKWRTQCNNCIKLSFYPKSIWLDNSKRNFNDKKLLFSSLKNIVIVTPSDWLKRYVKESFLSEKKIIRIYNGIDLNVFKPTFTFSNKNETIRSYVLGVANVWSNRKGFTDFISLRQILPEKIDIILIGLQYNRIQNLPKGIIGIAKTDSAEMLAYYYTNAICFINPTYQDNFPTTNIEALACGTPVVTYDTGGSPEAVDEHTGIVVSKGDVKGLADAISKILLTDRNVWREKCRQRAEKLFNKEKQFKKYIDLYTQLA